MLTLDLVQTLAFAGLVLFLGYGVRSLVPWLARLNVPAPVVGGLLVASALLVARNRGLTPVAFDTALQTPLMVAFFTTVGFGASVSVLRIGGPQVMLFFAFSTLVAILQNVVGVAVATSLGQHPLLGVLASSVTLVGGPATGLAFAPDFERAGLAGAATLAVASAMVGIVGGGILGGRSGRTSSSEASSGRPSGVPVALSPQTSRRTSWRTCCPIRRRRRRPARTSRPMAS